MNTNETQLRICNLALTKLRIAQRLAAVDITTVEGGVFLAVWEQVLNEVLELGEWRCARKRVTLERDKDDVEDATAAEPVVITATAHTFRNGDLVGFTGVVGMTELNGNTYMVANAAANTFELYDENGTVKLDGTGFTAYVSDGVIWRIPNWDYLYMFKLPTDCIKVLETAVDRLGWVEENNFILTNAEDDELSILYTYYLSDPTYFSPLLADTIATRLATVAGPSVGADKQRIAELDQEFAALLRLSREQDIRYRQPPDQPSTLITDL
jgi:hypothetical protein